MQERGLDLSGHRSQPTESTLLKQFDIIVVMEIEHKHVLQERNPGLADRILTIRELSGGSGDFADPVGGSVDIYRKAANSLYDLLSEGWDEIEQRVT